MWTIIGALAGQLLKLFTYETARYMATRALVLILVVGVLPIMLFKGYTYIMKFVLSYGMELLGTMLGNLGISAQVISIAGCGAYLCQEMMVGQGISIFMSFLLLKFVWGFLPGVR